MPNGKEEQYSIEARSLGVAGAASHNFLVLRDGEGRALAEIHGLTAENVMAIGDNFNDLEMLEYAGIAVVMGNASPVLLEREDFFSTVSNDESGVAVAIERFIL